MTVRENALPVDCHQFDGTGEIPSILALLPGFGPLERRMRNLIGP